MAPVRHPILGLLVVLGLLSGCASSSPPTGDGDLLVLVHGAGGDGFYPLREGLKDAKIGNEVWTMRWGAPTPLFVFNLQDRSIHGRAETKLAEYLAAWREKHPTSRLVLLGHSAGCGVILGALRRSQADLRVDRVILLGPSVSPGYDLSRALAQVTGDVRVFHSDKDVIFLRWRTRTFGTYDSVRAVAAGNVGFDLSRLGAATARKVLHQRYDPAWADLGNHGGHGDWLARNFAKVVLAPLISGLPQTPQLPRPELVRNESR